MCVFVNMYTQTHIPIKLKILIKTSCCSLSEDQLHSGKAGLLCRQKFVLGFVCSILQTGLILAFLIFECFTEHTQ